MFIRSALILLFISYIIFPGELKVENAGFESAVTEDGRTVPAAWKIHKWTPGASAVCALEAGASGKYAASIRPNAAGGIGFASPGMALPLNWKTLAVTFQLKLSDDIVKHTPWAFIAWNAGQKYLGRKNAELDAFPRGQWKEVRILIDRTEIAADADTFMLCLAAQGDSDGSGAVMYDDISVRYEAAQKASAASLVPNSGFEAVENGKPYPQPSQWSLTRWNAKNDSKELGVTTDDAASGTRSLFINASEIGYIGYASAAVSLPGEYKFVHVSAAIKMSAEMNALPWMFITWNKGNTFISRSDLPADVSKGSWQTISLEVPRAEMPKDADNFRINFGTRGQKDPKGALYIDDVTAAAGMSRHDFRLAPAARFAWFEDAPVRFICEDPPAGLTSVQGTVFTSAGDTAAQVNIGRDVLIANGWVWHAPQPGFYEMEFTYTEAGQTRPMVRSFTMRGKDSVKRFGRDRFGVAVVKKRAYVNRPQFGFNLEFDDDECMGMARMTGMGFMRLWAHWGYNWRKENIVNPEKGVYQWGYMDRAMVLADRYGFQSNVVTVYGTPRWASPYPERTDIDICVPRYSAWMPRELFSWTVFLRDLVTRYKERVSDWQLWNEPHLPTGSVYWRDTTENFASLMKSGYDTIKGVMPNANVWLGGQAGRGYIPFYKEYLKAGGFPYYDTLTMHGSFPETRLYWDLEKQQGHTPKPWSSSEWHAILIGSSASDNIPDERELGRRMLTDLLLQLKYNVERIVIFEMQNLDEMESLQYARANGIFTHCSGLFRKRPDQEPRIAAVVMRNFLDRIGGRVRYAKEFDLGTQKAVLLSADAGPLLVVWNEGKAPETIDARLSRTISASSTAVSWEGKPWNDRVLDTRSTYLIEQCDESQLRSLSVPATALLYPLERKKASSDANAVRGTLSPSPIVSPNADTQWNTEGWQFKGIRGAARPDGFKARFAVHCGTAGLDLLVEVRDTVHVQNEKPGQAYNGDSLQFALDADASGADGSQTEISVALTPDGPVVWKHLASFIGGNIPQNWTAAGHPAQHARADVDRQDGRTLYKVHIDWTEFYPFVFETGKPLRFSVLVNDNDGNGRLGWLEWGGGIGEKKDPSLFGKLSE
ncbi:MAG: hypothetical protein AABZ39_08880 [Spirochaetota bacterium]